MIASFFNDDRQDRLAMEMSEFKEVLKTGTQQEIEKFMVNAEAETVLSLGNFSESWCVSPYDYLANNPNIGKKSGSYGFVYADFLETFYIRPLRNEWNNFKSEMGSKETKDLMAAAAATTYLILSFNFFSNAGDRQREIDVWRSDEARPLYLSSRPELAEEFTRQCREQDFNAQWTAIQKNINDLKGQTKDNPSSGRIMNVTYMPFAEADMKACVSEKAEERVAGHEQSLQNQPAFLSAWLLAGLLGAGVTFRSQQKSQEKISGLTASIAEIKANVPSFKLDNT